MWLCPSLSAKSPSPPPVFLKSSPKAPTSNPPLDIGTSLEKLLVGLWPSCSQAPQGTRGGSDTCGKRGTKESQPSPRSAGLLRKELNNLPLKSLLHHLHPSAHSTGARWDAGTSWVPQFQWSSVMRILGGKTLAPTHVAHRPVIPVLSHPLDGSLVAGRVVVSKCLLTPSPPVAFLP